MGLFSKSDNEKAAAAAGKADVKADKKAGGFAKGGPPYWDGGDDQKAEEAYTKAYTKRAPKSWYR